MELSEQIPVEDGASTIQNIESREGHNETLVLDFENKEETMSIQNKASVEEVKQGMHLCDICTEKFSSEANLAKHYTMMHREIAKARNTDIENEEMEKHVCECCTKVLYQSLNVHQSQTCRKAPKQEKIDTEVEEKVESVFICSKCGKEYSNKKLLIRHELCHSGSRDHICEICNKKFASIYSLRNHIAIHTGESISECHICFKKVAASSFSEHMRLHTGDRRHICHICGKDYIQMVTLEEHLLSHTGEKRHQCNICGKRFCHRSTLRNHRYIHSDTKRFMCDKCGRGFNFKSMFLDHTCLNKEANLCKICNRHFAHRGSFYRHMRIHTGEKQHKCTLCGKEFIQKGSLNLHMKTHESGKINTSKCTENTCDICNKIFSSQKYLDNHKKNHNIDPVIAAEPSSDDILIDEDSMNVSIEIIYEDEFAMEIERKDTFLEDYMKRKRVTYNRGMRFICDICKLKFTDETTLANHKLTHVDDLSDEDGLKDNLKNDIKVDDPVFCQICKLKFINKLSLELHMETHTASVQVKEKAPVSILAKVRNGTKTNFFSCSKCSKKFLNQISLDAHKIIHVNDDDDDDLESNKPSKKRRSRKKKPAPKNTPTVIDDVSSPENTTKDKFMSDLCLEENKTVAINEQKLMLPKLPCANLATDKKSPMKLILLKIEPENADVTAKPPVQTVSDIKPNDQYVLAIVQDSDASQLTNKKEIVKSPKPPKPKKKIVPKPQPKRGKLKNILPKTETPSVTNSVQIATTSAIPNFHDTPQKCNIKRRSTETQTDLTLNTENVPLDATLLTSVLLKSENSGGIENGIEKEPKLSVATEKIRKLSKDTEKVLKLKIKNENLQELSGNIEKVPELSESTETVLGLSENSNTDEIRMDLDVTKSTETANNLQTCEKSGTRYVCNICYKLFTQKILLQEHMITHTDLDVYECTECPKIFCHENALRVHKLIHSNVNLKYTFLDVK